MLFGHVLHQILKKHVEYVASIDVEPYTTFVADHDLKYIKKEKLILTQN